MNTLYKHISAHIYMRNKDVTTQIKKNMITIDTPPNNDRYKHNNACKYTQSYTIFSRVIVRQAIN